MNLMVSREFLSGRFSVQQGPAWFQWLPHLPGIQNETHGTDQSQLDSQLETEMSSQALPRTPYLADHQWVKRNAYY